MSLQLDSRLETGTRFRIFPQPRFLQKHGGGGPLFTEPEVVVVSVPPAAIRPGPADDRMFVIDAVSKLPYNRFLRPPYRGSANPPVKPGPDGHFDHIDPKTREFSAATMYATVRRVLDIWQDYFGHRLDWHFESQFERLELIPLIDWDNAQSGFGFLEFGFGRTASGTVDHTRPYCENFDVLAHELGHSIIFSEVGFPSSPADDGIDYGGMQESSGDLVAIIASLHFHSLVDHLLASTRGNLLTINGLDRVGELSDSREIRVAFNAMRMSDVVDEPHDRSLPLTGAIFDTMVEVFQQDLVDKMLISEDLRARSTNLPGSTENLTSIQADFDAAYTGNEKAFKEALLLARDYLQRHPAWVSTGRPRDHRWNEPADHQGLLCVARNCSRTGFTRATVTHTARLWFQRRLTRDCRVGTSKVRGYWGARCHVVVVYVRSLGCFSRVYA